MSKDNQDIKEVKDCSSSEFNKLLCASRDETTENNNKFLHNIKIFNIDDLKSYDNENFLNLIDYINKLS